MLNHVDIMGRLTQAPEMKKDPEGDFLSVTFTLEVECDYCKKGGELEYGFSSFIDCYAWGPTAEFVSKHFTKGSLVIVSGSLNSCPWKACSGNKHNAVEVWAERVFAGGSMPVPFAEG